MKFAAIADWAESDSYTVTFMCAQLDAYIIPIQEFKVRKTINIKYNLTKQNNEKYEIIW